MVSKSIHIVIDDCPYTVSECPYTVIDCPYTISGLYSISDFVHLIIIEN